MPAEKQTGDLFQLYGDFHSPVRLAADAETLTDRYGRFSAQPFEQGFGTTLGNSLRRALLSSIEGAAITAVKIEGVEHEFASINGVAEDATDLILNLKQVPFKLYTREVKTLRITKEGAGEVTSADIEADADVVILDPTIHIATVTEGGALKVEMRLKRARGYVSADRNLDKDLEVGYIPIDSVHTPVKKVNYNVESARLGESTAFDKLTLEVWTDGSVSPEDAVGLAAKLIKDQLSIFINFEEDTDDLPLLKMGQAPSTDFEQMKGRLHKVLLNKMDFSRLAQLEPEQLHEEVKRLASSMLALVTLEEKANVELAPAVRGLVQEESIARNYVTQRYRSLVDRKYLNGLTPTENEELEGLKITLDQMDEPYYDAIMRRLRDLIEESRT